MAKRQLFITRAGRPRSSGLVPNHATNHIERLGDFGPAGYERLAANDGNSVA